MRNLDVATLRSLLAVAEYGAVTRAAEALNMTQSAISMQMKRLEEVFGRPVLLKQGRGVILSDFGFELLTEARKMLAHNDAIIARFMGERPEGRLRVGLTCDWMIDKVAQATRAFRQDHPRIELVINTARSRDLRRQLKQGDHDLILTTEFESPPGAIHLGKADLAWAGAVGGKVWMERPFPFANSPDCSYTPAGMEALDRAGIEWRQMIGEGGKDTWRVLASADLGVTIIPADRPEAGLEIIEHNGALPPLPQTWLNVHVNDGPGQHMASDFICYLRSAVCEVATEAAAA
ncbi:LysR family transcriptional regulator [Paracoccus methylarcula]|uniref:LysR family transcriptional regulator n=1 Tax=Paracoccus methylarcula TaxID=72022 RepID=A0A422R0A7_9RHOB|nr:LysR family transcriptional regulator [Paracoccus methylarcula]RNF35642.1 LysR family transcriptional regulator [Paracoccus methylarcula]